jgi:hypothetical protein
MAEDEPPKDEKVEPKPDAEPSDNGDDTTTPTVSRVDAIWKTLTQDDKVTFYNLAVERQKQLEEEAAKPKEEVKPEPEPDDPIEKIVKKLNEVEARLAARDEKDKKDEETKKKAQEWTDFFASLDTVLDADDLYAKDTEARQELKKGYTGHWFADKPRDVVGSFKAYLERDKARIAKAAGKTKEDYVRGKLKDAHETRGETTAGSVPPKSEYKPTGADLDSGELAERIKREYGVA